MVDIIDYLTKVRMSCIINICKVNQSRFKNSHPSIVNSINDLNSFEFFYEIKYIIPIYQETFLLIILHHFGIFLEQNYVSSKPLCNIVSFLIVNNLFFIILVKVRSVKHNLFKLDPLI